MKWYRCKLDEWNLFRIQLDHRKLICFWENGIAVSLDNQVRLTPCAPGGFVERRWRLQAWSRPEILYAPRWREETRPPFPSLWASCSPQEPSLVPVSNNKINSKSSSGKFADAILPVASVHWAFPFQAVLWTSRWWQRPRSTCGSCRRSRWWWDPPHRSSPGMSILAGCRQTCARIWSSPWDRGGWGLPSRIKRALT